MRPSSPTLLKMLSSWLRMGASLAGSSVMRALSSMAASSESMRSSILMAFSRATRSITEPIRSSACASTCGMAASPCSPMSLSAARLKAVCVASCPFFITPAEMGLSVRKRCTARRFSDPVRAATSTGTPACVSRSAARATCGVGTLVTGCARRAMPRAATLPTIPPIAPVPTFMARLSSSPTGCAAPSSPPAVAAPATVRGAATACPTRPAMPPVRASAVPGTSSDAMEPRV